MEWVEKASFTYLNKLFKIDAIERAHIILLSNKNLQALIENPELFISQVFPRLVLPSLVPDKHFVLKDLPFYEVVHLADSEACKARLEECEKKRHEGTLRQAPIASCPISSFVVHLFAQKKKLTTHPIQKAKTLPLVSPSSLSSSSHYFSLSSSSSRDETETGESRLVLPIICKEEEEEKMATNLRARFYKRQYKRLSKSIIINPFSSKKAHPASNSDSPSRPTTLILTKLSPRGQMKNLPLLGHSLS